MFRIGTLPRNRTENTETMHILTRKASMIATSQLFFSIGSSPPRAVNNVFLAYYSQPPANSLFLLCDEKLYIHKENISNFVFRGRSSLPAAAKEFRGHDRNFSGDTIPNRKRIRVMSPKFRIVSPEKFRRSFPLRPRPLHFRSLNSYTQFNYIFILKELKH